jgi:hypothetical protein
VVSGDVDDTPRFECGDGMQCYPHVYYEWAAEEYGLPGPMVHRWTRFVPLPKSRYLMTNGDVLNVQMLSGADLGTVNVITKWFLINFIHEPMYRCRLPDMGGTDSGELVHEGRNRLTMTLYTRDIAELIITHRVLGVVMNNTSC